MIELIGYIEPIRLQGEINAVPGTIGGGGGAPAEIKLQEKTITENGEYTADSGYDGLSKVTVNVPTGGGGECDKPHIVEVDTLPTENIDKNAVYLCGGSYYKYAPSFDDVIGVADGQAGSIADEINAEMPVELYIIPTKTTEGIIDVFATGVYAIYYIEDENALFVYIAPYGGWLNFGELLNAGSFGGIITDISEADTEGYYYALMQMFGKLVTANGSLRIASVGTYNVLDKETVIVDIPDAALCGIWKFNDAVDLSSGQSTSIKFSTTNANGATSNYVRFEFIIINDVPTMRYELATGTYPSAYKETTGWVDDMYKVVNFGAEPQMVSSAFKEWLTANATPIYTITPTE